jgi:hypothetical protein
MANAIEYREPVLCLFKEHLIALAVLSVVWKLWPRRLSGGWAFGSNVIVSQSAVSNVAGGLVIINGKRITSNYTKRAAAQFKLVAVDEDGETLEEVELPFEPVALEIDAGEDGRIESVEVMAGSLNIVQSGDIGSIKSASGDIRIEKCGNVNVLESMSGNIDIGKCERLGETSNMSGDIRVRREKSPRRH